jgi:hypothetical protein
VRRYGECSTTGVVRLFEQRAERAAGHAVIQVLPNLGNDAIKYNVESGWVLLTAIPYKDVVRFVGHRGQDPERRAGARDH